MQTIAPADHREKVESPILPEIRALANDFVREYGAVIMKDALRYSLCRADAEDAYARALEILVTKAPTTDPEHLVPWIRTVVRREAVAILRSTHNERNITFDEAGNLIDTAVSPDATPDEHVETVADLQIGSDALRRLTDDQVTCLLAQATGLTYLQISETTGFSERKVSRCVNDGRKAFLEKVDAIESGSECEQMQNILFRIVDGDSAATIEAGPHLKHCAACRSRLRTYQSASKTVAAFFPPAVVLVDGGAASWTSALSDSGTKALDWLAIRAFRTQQWAEVGTGQKVGALTAVVASLALGGFAVNEARESSIQATGIAIERVQGTAVAVAADEPSSAGPAAKSSARKAARQRAGRSRSETTASPSPSAEDQSPAAGTSPAPAPAQQGQPGLDDGSSEFLPEAR